MFPKPAATKNRHRNRNQFPSQYNAGFLIPLSLFILVGLGALAIAINRMSSQANTSVTLEGVSLQAFYAAETGAQYALHMLMYDVAQRDGTNGSDENCDDMISPSAIPEFPHTNAAGLQGCSVVFTCTQKKVGSNPISYYTINSTATCGGGNLVSERTIEVSAFL